MPAEVLAPRQAENLAKRAPGCGLNGRPWPAPGLLDSQLSPAGSAQASLSATHGIVQQKEGGGHPRPNPAQWRRTGEGLKRLVGKWPQHAGVPEEAEGTLAGCSGLDTLTDDTPSGPTGSQILKSCH